LASGLSHAAAALSMGTWLYRPGMPKRAWMAGAVCSVLPDLDVVGFRFGIRYGDFSRHRGFLPSLLFAALLAAFVTLVSLRHSSPGKARYFLPRRPIRVSPMGVSRFFTGRGLAVLSRELLWIGLPAALVAAAAWVWRRRAREKLSSRGQAAHEFLFADQQVAQPRAGGVGLDAALHFGKFLLGLTLLERFDAA